ncbi:ULK/ULK protein kinase [Magnaporthiopsis poae ATCC 64411]|uniref:non-specific serine/threonine protein kinase n=1 Tax=Magnaporthiopsis poae (strain ATCC 64411 / 73-15) TaxID=644358 RepID=A0A0C4E666_MAGP6|nr:ULK/ULK protein kinase [Magnaporthiopsis poae ATCC 64411]
MADRTSSSSSRRARPGDDSVGQFTIGAEIGKGSFAQVYMGRHKVSGAAVAIKSVELARLNKKLKENLYGEIKILKTLRHPHIVALHDCVESATHINLMMEYCELGDLSLFIRKREKLLTHPATHDMARKYPSALNSGLNEVVIRHFLKQLASALKFLREGNFVHRDVKPQNLLLLPSPEYRDVNKTTRPILTASQDSLIPVAGLSSLPMLKLADFGFARVLPSTSLAETLCGSPLYMAPEILRYERYDAKADLWSVGTVLYEMVTGRPPFRASNHVELLRKIEAAEDVIKFPRETVVSPEMKSLVRALLKRNPVERLSFEHFFNHAIVLSPIPGLVEDDLPKADHQRTAKEVRKEARTDDPVASPRRHSFRRYPTDQDAARGDEAPASPQEKAAPRQSAAEVRRQHPGPESTARVSHSPKADPVLENPSARRPPAQPSASAPNRTALTLLAKSMDIASLWWARRSRGEHTMGGGTSSSAPSSASAQTLSLRINSAVQWVRSRFNEVLEKAEVVRLRLLEAQRRLPDDHPSHPGNHPREVEAVNSASTEGVFLTAGVTAERLMYDRAVEMSRTAAINEITNEDLAGCEISYVTAIRMLEAVLDNEGSSPKRRTSGLVDDGAGSHEDGQVEINVDDQQSVQKLIQMIKSRLSSVRNKARMISNASKAQQQQSLARRRSGEVTPRSVPS